MPAKDLLPDRAGAATHALGRFEAFGQYRDLCSNCDNAEACGGRTRPRRPIFFCEEFMVYGAVPALESDRIIRDKPRLTPSTNGHIGLCVNCDNARTCISPKPDGGIWHCEEYR